MNTKLFLIALLLYITRISPLTVDSKTKIRIDTTNEFNIPLTEDPMSEHGILNRVLLVYEEIIRRIDTHTDFPSTLNAAVTIIRSFIEDYHEKLKEDYIFPLFEKQKKEVRLVKTLKNQHIRGTGHYVKIKTNPYQQ